MAVETVEEKAMRCSIEIQGMEYRRIRAACERYPWAILPEKLAEIVSVLEIRERGEYLSEETVIAATNGRKENNGAIRKDSIAVVPLYGSIFQKANVLTEFSGGTSTEKFGAMMSELVNDSAVKAIVIDTDSPGGNTAGVPELASKIFEMRGHKRIVAVANSMMASAAYWIGSAAGELVAAPSALVGSIGVLAMHTDYSKQMEWRGMKTSIISAGKYKGEGSPYAPLSEEARAGLQDLVNSYYELFVSAVAQHRGVSADEVKGGFGEGRVLLAQSAVKERMVDRVETLDQTIQRLSAETGARHVIGASAHSVKLLDREVDALEK